MEKILLSFFIILMGIYYSSSLASNNKENNRKRFVVYISCILILLSGLRSWEVGLNSDTRQYQYIFESVKASSWSELIYNFIIQYGKDPFYEIFQKGFQLFSKDYQSYLVFVAIIIFSAFGNFIYSNTTEIRHVVLAFIVYLGYFYGFYSITGTRQALATAFLLFSFPFIKRRKVLPFVVLVSIAGLFHLSALVFLPLYLIANIKKARLTIALAVLGFPIVFYFKNSLAVFFVASAGVEDRFGFYAEQFSIGGSLVLTVFFVLLGIISLFLANRVLKNNPETGRLYNMFSLALFFFPLQWVNPSAGRISLYFAITIMVWIPYLIDAFSGNMIKTRRMLYSLTIVLFIFLISFTLRSGNPYKFFWQ